MTAAPQSRPRWRGLERAPGRGTSWVLGADDGSNIALLVGLHDRRQPGHVSLDSCEVSRS
ncbi:MAG: hypothetical protein QOF96_2624 [Actinomycetota bacterium]|jgi:hypothetical protein|nr:hypothetical protein [Actinomycetota bacterium]